MELVAYNILKSPSRQDPTPGDSGVKGSRDSGDFKLRISEAVKDLIP
jgi:hypothetical protein